MSHRPKFLPDANVITLRKVGAIAPNTQCHLEQAIFIGAGYQYLITDGTNSAWADGGAIAHFNAVRASR